MNIQNMKKSAVTVLMITAIAGLVIVPLAIHRQSEFKGTDDGAVEMIQGIDRHYKPWFEGIHLFESEEITSTLFALQATIGALVIGYYIGYSRGKKSE